MQLGDVDEFCMTMRMPPHIYGDLLEQLTPKISKEYTNFRPPISADVRLSITLRYLALGKNLHGKEPLYTEIDTNRVCGALQASYLVKIN